MRNTLMAILMAAASGLGAAPGDLPSLKETALKVRPSVVNLSVVKNVKTGVDGQDPFMDQFFNRFFGGPGPNPGLGREETYKQRSLGSGVVVDAARGYILTNNHVVEGADAITVKLYDKRELDATVVGRDPKTDLAVIKVKKAEGLVAAPFGDSDAIDVGDWVLAVGSPFGLEQTVSHGIISAKGRVIGEGPYDDFLQTDAPINPGNSGGPLVDLAGEVVGINTAITTRSGGSEGIGFAIPSNLARGIYRQLVDSGKVVRGWLGVSIQDLDPTLARHFGLAPTDKGVLVSDVMDKGPARQAGLRSGDVIRSFNGKPVEEVRDLQRRVAETAVGQSASLGLWRDGSSRTLSVTVGNMADFDEESTAVQSPADAPKMGMEVKPLDPDEARQRHLDHGVVVAQVEPGSAAERAGVEAGDVVLEMDHSRVSSPEGLAALVKRLKDGDSVVLHLERGGHGLFLSVTLGEDTRP